MILPSIHKRARGKQSAGQSVSKTLCRTTTRSSSDFSFVPLFLPLPLLAVHCNEPYSPPRTQYPNLYIFTALCHSLIYAGPIILFIIFSPKSVAKQNKRGLTAVNRFCFAGDWVSLLQCFFSTVKGTFVVISCVCLSDS